jgi:hypothetical protein
MKTLDDAVEIQGKILSDLPYTPLSTEEQINKGCIG